MAIADAPAGEPHLDGVHVGPVVAVAVGHEQQIRRRPQPQATKAHGDGGGEGDPLQEHRTRVGVAVVVGVLENQNPARAVAREAPATRLVVAVLRNPHPALGIPAEGHGLTDHRLRRIEIGPKSLGHRHPLDGPLRREISGDRILGPCPVGQAARLEDRQHDRDMADELLPHELHPGDGDEGQAGATAAPTAYSFGNLFRVYQPVSCRSGRPAALRTPAACTSWIIHSRRSLSIARSMALPQRSSG